MCRAVCGDGGTKSEIRRRIQVGASAWRKVEGVMGDIHVCRKQKGKVISSWKTPAYLYGLETMAKKKNNKRNCKKVCKNNWVRRIARVKRINKRRMEELREEVGA